MKQILIIATLVIAFAQGIVMAGLQTPKPQSGGGKQESKVRRIQVNAETIAQLSGGKKYVVDLTQRSVIYVLDSKKRPIDFTRVMVRTAAGEVPISSWLEKNLSKTPLAGWNSRHLRIGTTEGFRSVRGLTVTTRVPPAGTVNFQCGSLLCSCKGDPDCNGMFSTNVCGPHAACDLDTGICVCLRTAH
jgi:hypothetical protein